MALPDGLSHRFLPVLYGAFSASSNICMNLSPARHQWKAHDVELAQAGMLKGIYRASLICPTWFFSVFRPPNRSIGRFHTHTHVCAGNIIVTQVRTWSRFAEYVNASRQKFNLLKSWSSRDLVSSNAHSWQDYPSTGNAPGICNY